MPGRAAREPHPDVADPPPGHESRTRPAPLDHDAVRVVADLAVDAAGIGTYDWDLTTGRLHWDQRMLALFGYSSEAFDHTIESFNSRVHPEDLGWVSHAIQAAIGTCSDYDLEYRLHLPDGPPRWVAARGRVLAGEDGTAARVIGAAYDTTARQESEARVTRILESIPTAFLSLDRSWRFVYVNAEAERVLGHTRDELIGQDLWELFPAAVGSDFERYYRSATDDGLPASFEAYYPEPLDRWYEVRAWPNPEGLSVYFLDISTRRRAQRSAEEAAARAALTARVTSELAETLEAEEAVARLAQLVVPALADWCVVTVVEEPEGGNGHHRLRDIASWHTDPDLRPQVSRYATLRLSSLKNEAFLNQALSTSQVITVPQDAHHRIHEVLHPGEARDLFDELAPASAAILPMRARGRTVGALSLFNAPHRTPISPEDLVNAEEVAGRAGLALDNSRLYREQRQLAEGFQRSLLTQPPEPDHVQITVRYVPAAEAAKVGGDWYDAFMQQDGATVLVIGDVVGHDTAAAAAMGQLRSILRGIGVTTGSGPAELLQQVDKALQTLQSDTIATAVVARIEQTDDERRRGVTHVRWANAGHPDPMIINPDGSIAVMAGVRPDVLLGVRPDTRRIEAEITLDRGATVLLYTDGLVERRDLGLREGMATLRDILEDLAAQDLTLDELCDAVLARMLPSHPSDDVALVAVRLHRQDRPRPPEAGPNSIPPGVAESPETIDQPP